ncbi:MAG: GNAT family N-acetyltransferase [Ignavibacteria bacterium]|nr:GNAT family N-acetyltransferase [Ignavibacteria bacterium]
MKIEEVTAHTLNLVNKIDSTFTVDSILRLKLSDNKYSYEIENVTPYEKKYGYENIDYSAFIDNKDKIVFFVFIDKELAGQVILIKHWSNYASIEDIRVERKFRGKGIGSKLIQKSIEWAKSINSIGIVVETQNVNVKACLFYRKNGFVLGGADMYIYKASELEKNEILLNWYLLF